MNTANELFGIAFNFQVEVIQSPLPHKVPTAAPYSFPLGPTSKVLKHLRYNQRPIWVYGPTGSGKTSLVLQMGARLNRHVFVAPCSADTELADLIASKELLDGRTVLCPGPLMLAALTGGWLVLDEGNLVGSTKVAKALNPILDGCAFEVPEIGAVLEDGTYVPKTIQPAEGFRVFVTANDDGTGAFAASNGYAVTRHDSAFLNRFAKVFVDYMSPEDETNMLVSQVGDEWDRLILSRFVQMGSAIRNLAKALASSRKPVPVHMSNRDLLDWVYQALSMTKAGISANPTWEAFQDLFLDGVSQEVVDPIAATFQDVFGIKAEY